MKKNHMESSNSKNKNFKGCKIDHFPFKNSNIIIGAII